MKAKRLWWTLRTMFIRGGLKRADYARKNKIYAHVGQNVAIQSRNIPLYPELISLHNNIVLASHVVFCTHDVIHLVLNRLPENERKSYKLKERIGCIEIMDNCFIGANTIILYDTRIGPNVIIGSGSVITKDCEPNSIYAGCPAKKIGTFEEFVKKRILNESSGDFSTTVHNQNLTEEEVAKAWADFNRFHSKR